MFPAAATPGDDEHPPGCVCVPCIDALVAELSTPLVVPRPRTDPALVDRKQDAYTDWLFTRPAPALTPATRRPQLVAARCTSGPGRRRRPSGPGRRRHPRTGRVGRCVLLVAALVAFSLLGWAAVAAVVWWLVS